MYKNNEKLLSKFLRCILLHTTNTTFGGQVRKLQKLQLLCREMIVFYRFNGIPSKRW